MLHTLAVAGAACVLSAGLVYVGYFLHVLRVARKAPCLPERGECVLLFGKHAPHGRIDRDFDAAPGARRAAVAPASAAQPGAARRRPRRHADRSRNRARRRCSRAASRPTRRCGSKRSSRDTLQNLRNARELLRTSTAGEPFGRVTLLSNRYHLARCALFAASSASTGNCARPKRGCRCTSRTVWRIAGEAAYVCWSDIGTRWARLIGHRRMLARVT